jgi:hypothetical protein
MRIVIFILSISAAMASITAAPVFASGNPSGTGQPSQTCLSSTALLEPGHAASAPGSAFNENGGIAGSMYAGSQPQNSNNPKSVSQYDVACFQVSNPEAFRSYTTAVERRDQRYLWSRRSLHWNSQNALSLAT